MTVEKPKQLYSQPKARLLTTIFSQPWPWADGIYSSDLLVFTKQGGAKVEPIQLLWKQDGMTKSKLMLHLISLVNLMI